MKSSIKVMLSAVALTGLIGTSVYASANGIGNDNKNGNDNGQEIKVLVQENKKLVNTANGIEFHAFKESAEKNEVETFLKVDSESFTKESVKEYKNNMPNFVEELRQNGHKNVPATVTFNKPLSKNELKNIVENNKLDVESFTIRTVHADGTTGTIVGVPSENELIPEDTLNEFLEESNAEYVGIYAIEGNVSTDANDFDALQNDENIYLTDVSENIIKDEVSKSNKFKELRSKNPKHHLDVHIPDFYWFVENKN